MYGYIYLITNRVNGKIYVGQHKYDKMELDPNYHGGGTMLHNAYKKYGISKFDTTLIDTADTIEELNQKEIFYIDVLKSTDRNIGYNITEGGGGVSGYKHSQTTIDKISTKLKGKQSPMKGKHQSDEAKQKQSKSMKGEKNPFYGKQHTDETKHKISETKKGKYTGENSSMYGKHLTEEAKHKISEALTGKHTGEKNPAAKKCVYNDIEFGSKIDAYNYAKDYCGYTKSYSRFKQEY